MKPLCFVLMPGGQKSSTAGQPIDFDALYNDLIAPGIRAAGLEPLRADRESSGDIIDKPTFEQLMLCEFAVADLTTANANIFFELGLRHAERPASTLLLFAAGSGPLPFDGALLRALPYTLGADGKPQDLAQGQAAIAARLKEAQDLPADSPVYQLVDAFPDIQRLKTDVFRERVHYQESIKSQLASARKAGLAALQTLAAGLEPLAAQEAGVVIDLYLSYRALKAWPDMIALVQKMAPPLARSVMVQEQLALALNRNQQGEAAETVLLELLDRQGPSSETYSILGRVYKDRWDAACRAGDISRAAGLLDQAIEAYLKGFEADWRDAFPGINAITLMELREEPDPRREKLIPVVTYAVDRRIETGKPDYWDHATRLELAVLGKQEAAARINLGKALAMVRESWEPESTARNLGLIRRARQQRGESIAWAQSVEDELIKASH